MGTRQATSPHPHSSYILQCSGPMGGGAERVADMVSADVAADALPSEDAEDKGRQLFFGTELLHAGPNGTYFCPLSSIRTTRWRHQWMMDQWSTGPRKPDPWPAPSFSFVPSSLPVSLAADAESDRTRGPPEPAPCLGGPCRRSNAASLSRPTRRSGRRHHDDEERLECGCKCRGLGVGSRQANQAPGRTRDPY